MAPKFICARCAENAKNNGVKPRQFAASEFWNMPNDREGSCRCPDCGHTNQRDAPLFIRTTFQSVEEI